MSPSPALRSKRHRWRAAATAVALVALAHSRPAAGVEVIQLLDNTQIMGSIQHYYDGVFQVETAGGQKMDLPRDKVKAITFKLPPSRAELSTPEKAFQRWRDAVVRGDLARIVDCYALMYQGLLAAQFAQSADELKKLQKEVEGTKFEVKSSKVTGDVASLKIQRTHGEDVMTAELRLVLENGEWKLTP